ncbi:hypothetical protein BG011_006508 [Mortierella polycephala]|uniref:DUF7492 domain-containing protein n=1 Tax=Mortierella polycephala TaxID=41804 RepID=A0A9P6PSK7_9FUNG|nr:hypothetical protein BG011_006508 [Mortierella polycephala]
MKAVLFSLGLILMNPSYTDGHSWLDCSNKVDSVCKGYPQGYPGRNDKDINTKFTYRVERRDPDAPVCQTGLQTTTNYTLFPPAHVTQGQKLRLAWQPDGHFDNDNPSTVEVHWTGMPNTLLGTRSQLTPETLLESMFFATKANCEQPSDPNTTCDGYITIPVETRPGKYQLVWWWKFDRNPQGEEYSTCFEIFVEKDDAIQARENAPQTHNQAQVEARAQTEEETVPQKFELAYLKSDSPSLINGDAPQIVTADEPLPTDPEIQKTRPKGNSYVDDDTGLLAGDAINRNEGTDTSPLPVMTPSQLINTTLSEQMGDNSSAPAAPSSSSIDTSANNTSGFDSTNVNNSTSSSNTANVGPQPTQSSASGIQPLSATTSSHPLSTPSLRPAAGSGGTYNRTLVGRNPDVDNAASDTMSQMMFSTTGTMLFSASLAMLTWMMA